MDNSKVDFNQVKEIFDQLSTAVYYGAATRNALYNDNEAYQAAKKLVDLLVAMQVPEVKSN